VISELPTELAPSPWLLKARAASELDVRRALTSSAPTEAEFAALISPAADGLLEEMAQRAKHLTENHFGRTISIYAPLYLSDYCPGGCAYCGFAADRSQPRSRLSRDEMLSEFVALKAMGFEEVLLLTGERSPQADFEYLRDAVAEAAKHFAAITVEAFPMTTDEYRELAAAGCVGVTLYQETYEPIQYQALHRWGPKRDYANRLDAPSRVLEAGMRYVGLGALLGISDPMFDTLALYRHARALRRKFWQSGVTISFPRVCPQEGGFQPPFLVDERLLARIIFAFRICMPDIPLVVSTRENAKFRDGIAGVGVSKMSIASRTTVGGYRAPTSSPDGQFQINDNRDIETFFTALRDKGLEPVFKNWDSVYSLHKDDT
jgi:2-iminoacetate synthase